MKSLIRLLLGTLWLFPCFRVLNAQSPDPAFFDEADAFFSQYVKNHSVDYAALTQRPAPLEALVQRIQETALEGATEATRQAFLINAYNLLVIHSVVEAYPINSPQMVNGFFDGRQHRVAGQSLTLNELEQVALLDAFGDARFHFVLVCAARGCPPLTPEAVRPERLEAQLAARTRRALNDPQFVRLQKAQKAVQLSPIFNWYRSDFGKNEEEVIAYINAYREDAIPTSYAIRHYPYDWSLNAYLPQGAPPPGGLANVQAFTPSVLLRKGQVEVKLFNNLYTQTAFRDENRTRIELGQRETFFTGIYQATLGVSQNRRINLGVEAVYTAVYQDADVGSSPLRIFGSNAETEAFRSAALAYLGPRIRVTPLASVPKFSITSTLQIPLSQDLEFLDDQGSRRFLSHNRVNWFTQFFYDKLFGDFQVFTEVDLLFRFKTDRVSFNQPAFFRTPVTVFLSYFPTPKSTLNINAQYSPAWGKGNADFDGTFTYLNDFLQVGIGAKYQITRDINLELLYTNFITSRSQGAGQTFNFGLVFLR